MVKVKIRSSNVKNHPYADFIGLLTPKLLKDMNIHPPHYVRINKVISHQNKQKNLEINVLVVSSESEISNLSSLCKDPLRDDEIGLDQTYRESLDVQIGEEIEIINTDQKFSLKERFLNKLNFQKAVVRIQANAVHMERQIPIACLCQEMIDSIGAKYGDKIILESTSGKYTVKCIPLAPRMQEFHDYVLSPPNDLVERKALKDKLTKKYFTDPADWGLNSIILEESGELVHPIFIDGMTMDALNVTRLHPLKINRSFQWELLKKLNSFGVISLLGLSVVAPFLVEHPDWISLWVWAIFLGCWGTWSIITSSKYKTSVE